MAYEYSDLITDIDSWAVEAEQQGWIDRQQLNVLQQKPEGSAQELFNNQSDRPLVVAFMGGTGVGKSSLLNKLAGQAIAKTGVVRPTSREVTLFHHHSVSLAQLQQIFPLQHIQLAQHSEQSNQQVLWIDMPDFDSTEEKNKDIVMQWLPFVDVLIYVVSPERYRDNKAWQLLLAEGASHAWLFVMNQWDRGDSAQYEDFKRQLAQAGFNEPIIYKTICHLENTDGLDELDQLQAAIAELSVVNTVAQLEIRHKQQRNNEIKQQLQECLHGFAVESVFQQLAEKQKLSWGQAKQQLLTGFAWPIKQTAALSAKTAGLTRQDKVDLWDDWAQSRFNDYLDELILSSDQQGLPSKLLRQYLTTGRQKAGQHIQTQTELACRKSLINPGNVLHRVLLKIVKLCEIFLPLICMAVVGYQLFQGYYDSAVSDQEFLGVDFAVHSLLLILISWLMPFFIGKKMQPSLEKAALKGLNNGLEAAMILIDKDVEQAMEQLKEQHQQITDALRQLLEKVELQEGEKAQAVENERLTRMLVK